jgi:hypothetical protein
MEATIQSVSDALLRFVSEAPEQKILGAKLGGLLRTACPTFSPSQFQSRNLRQFIRTYVPGIVEKGKSGPDYVYALSSSGEPYSSITDLSLVVNRAPQTTFEWKAFSNPSYPFVLTVNRLTGEFQTETQEAVPTEPWAILPKPSSDDHLQIARDFVQTLSEHTRTTLTETLAHPLWFRSFTAASRTSGVGSDWSSFRTSRLREMFDKAIEELGIPAVVKSGPTSSIPPRRGASRIMHNRRADVPSPSREMALRRLVQLVVAEMPISDLRNLVLPIGRVIDHIDELLK